MKNLIYFSFLFVSIGLTYKITSGITEELIGAQVIEGIINDHLVHKKLVSALEEGNAVVISSISNGMVTYNVELLETLVTSLESGSYSYLTDPEVSKGRRYLSKLNEEANK
ncbi:MAG: hypothetical protein JKY50_09005 [Oleispira sp.]|nr:hypothetical protein [Oleispira sp.]MBL4880948.1 hypothetical protein [Oleispira sp.]